MLVLSADNLIDEVVRRLSCSERDYSSNLVVFPGKMSSHLLRKAISKKERASFIPPQTFSMDAFVDFVYEGCINHTDRKIDPIDAVTLLYDIHKEAPARLGSNNFLTLDTFFSLGLRLYHNLEELYIEGVSPQAVKEINRLPDEKIPPLTVKRLQLLSLLYMEFYEKIKSNKCSTRSLRYRMASEKISATDFAKFSKIIFAGFFALTTSERILCRKLLNWENTLFIFQDGPGIEEKCRDIGMTVQSKHISGNPSIHFYRSPDTHGQVFGVSSILKGILKDSDNTLDEETAIILPSPGTLSPLLQHTLSIIEPPNYNISLKYPLYRTPIFGFFANLMQLILSMDGDRLFVPDYIAFVRHPYIKNIYFNTLADITASLFYAVENRLARNKTRRFLSLAEIENNEDIAESIREKVLQSNPDITPEMLKRHLRAIHQNTIEMMLSFKDVKDLAEKALVVFMYVHNNSAAPLYPLFYSHSEAFLRHIDVLSTSLMKDIRLAGANSYFALLKRYLMTCQVPFDNTHARGGVQVLGFMEARNLKAENLFFLDLNEDVIPGTRREEPILPHKVRQTLGLPTYIDRERLIAYYFETLIGGAKSVYLFYVEDDKRDRSRLLEKLLWERQKRERKKDASEYIKSIHYSVRLKDAPPAPIKKSDEAAEFLREYNFNASSLNVYLRCPLQFYYQYVLVVNKKEKVSGEIETLEIGMLVHEVLQEYFRKKTNRILNEKDMDMKELEQVIELLFKRHYGKDHSGKTYLLKRQIKIQLRKFIEGYQIPKISEYPIEILSLEHRVKIKKWVFRLNARLDRIEKRGNQITIIDYKASANANHLKIDFKKLDINDRDSWNRAIKNIQLPFYLLTYAGATGKMPEEINCMFLLLGKAELDKKIELPLFNNGADVQNKYLLLEQIILRLLNEIIDPQHPFMPTQETKEACSKCTFRYICINQR